MVVIILASFVFYNLFLLSTNDNRQNACVVINVSFGSSCYTNQSYASIYVNP